MKTVLTIIRKCVKNDCLLYSIQDFFRDAGATVGQGGQQEQKGTKGKNMGYLEFFFLCVLHIIAHLISIVSYLMLWEAAIFQSRILLTPFPPWKRHKGSLPLPGCVWRMLCIFWELSIMTAILIAIDMGGGTAGLWFIADTFFKWNAFYCNMLKILKGNQLKDCR